MGIFTKIAKGAAKNADDLFTLKPFRKGAAKVAETAKTAVKGFTNKGTLKTTAAITGQGVSQATAGGRKVIAKVAKNTAKGMGTTAKVAGKVIAGTAITAIPVVSGIGLVNMYKNSSALTDEDRRLKFLIDQQERVENNTPNVNATGNPDVDSNPAVYGNTGIGGNNGYGSNINPNGFNPFREVYGSNDQQNQNSGSNFGSLGMIAGVGLAAAGGYYLYKKSKKGKK